MNWLYGDKDEGWWTRKEGGSRRRGPEAAGSVAIDRDCYCTVATSVASRGTVWLFKYLDSDVEVVRESTR